MYKKALLLPKEIIKPLSLPILANNYLKKDPSYLKKDPSLKKDGFFQICILSNKERHQ